MQNRKPIYLASPYTGNHMDNARWAAEFTAKCLAYGFTVFSPIVHSHALVTQRDWPLPYDRKFWLDHDFTYMNGCSDLWVLALPGWQDSEGVNAERGYWWQVGKDTAPGFGYAGLVYQNSEPWREDYEFTRINPQWGR
jgi:hypothetical protein